jgi:hypothetical protein
MEGGWPAARRVSARREWQPVCQGLLVRPLMSTGAVCSAVPLGRLSVLPCNWRVVACELLVSLLFRVERRVVLLASLAASPTIFWTAIE